LRLSDLTVAAGSLWSTTGAYASDIMTPTLRLGVTGLARAGKTVFITSLIRNLTSGGRLPFFSPLAEGRIVAAHLEPQPDDDIPRFDYEAHTSLLERSPPAWPESTRRISELRLSFAFRSESRMRRLLGIRRLNLDIVDYPGEWLLDLAMLDQSYAEWSAEAIALASAPHRRALSEACQTFSKTIDVNGREDEQAALEGAKLFTDYLAAARERGPVTVLGPGRFLMPGDLEGSPLLTFFPLPISPDATPERGSMAAMMARRYESYVAHVVRPFFRDHFARLDRQVVLVDVLGALDGGAAVIEELERGLTQVLAAFRTGTNSWASRLTGRKIDKLLFAATKADHVHHTSHDRLENILRLMTDRAGLRAAGSGTDVGVMAIAALRATRETVVREGGTSLPCIAGIPLSGETLDGKVFDGATETIVFPGDLPEDPRVALDLAKAGRGTTPFSAASTVRFQPPAIVAKPSAIGTRTPPHIRLDRALEFLMGDWFA
jgi:uncharacterized protein